MALDQGLKVKGATVERGALYLAVNSKDSVNRINQQIMLINHSGVDSTDTEEQWKRIPGWEFYEASTLGRIRSFYKKTTPRILRGPADKNGYAVVSLTNKSTRKSFKVHVLVAATFIGERPEGFQVRHLDGNKLNNKPTNLAYGSAKENTNDRRRHGTLLKGERWHATQITDAEVALIRKFYALQGVTQQVLADMFRCSQAQISRIITKRLRA